jgi:glycosyltransferase involved in cell wall biosynthesis
MLSEAVASVLRQTHRPIEVIIVDDGSTDDTASVADSLARAHPEIRVIHQANQGVGRAREAARIAARGEFIQHLDSDDLLEPAKFATQLAGLRDHPDCDVSYGWTRIRFRDGSTNPEPWKRTGEAIDRMFPSMLRERWWDTSTPLYRHSVVERAGPWLPLRCEEDWEYDCRMAALGVRLQHVRAWVSETRRHDDHVSGRSEASVLRDRAAAHAAILTHAQGAGIGGEASEMRHFSRELFLLARQCGAAGLGRESSELFALAGRASPAEAGRVQFGLYGVLARVLGWSRMGRVSAALDRIRA